MKCFISSSCSAHGNVSDIVRELAGLGFKNIELTGNVRYCDNIEETILRLRILYDVDMIVHNYLPFQPTDFVLNLASTDVNIMEKTLDLIKNAVGLSKKLGKDLYSIHPGFRHDLMPEQDDNFFIVASKKLNERASFYRALAEIAVPLAQEHFRIAVENLSPKNAGELYSFLCTPEDIYVFLEYFKDTPNVGILLDMGHLNVAASLMSFDKYEVLDCLFQGYAHKVFALHISENDGSRDFHRISEFDSWQIQFLHNHRERLENTNVIFEWLNCATEETFRKFELIQRRLAVL